MKRIRVGVIGIGYMGRLHAKKYSLMKDVDLIGMADQDVEKASKVATKLGTLYCRNYKNFFGKVDAVSIATPTFTHFKIVRDFLKQNIHVMVEKPITESTCQADELIHISKNNNLVMQVGHIEQFNPALISIKDKVNNILFFESDRLITFKKRNTETSVVLDLMIHDLEILLSFVKSNVKNIHARGLKIFSNSVDVAKANLIFSNGAIANITASRIEINNKRTIKLLQKKSYITVDLIKYSVTEVIKDQHKQDNGKITKNFKTTKVDTVNYDQLNEQLKSFINSIKLSKKPIVTGNDAKRALSLAIVIEKKINRKL